MFWIAQNIVRSYWISGVEMKPANINGPLPKAQKFDSGQSYSGGHDPNSTVMSGEIVTLDVRDDIKRGQEPFAKIMSAVARLDPQEKLRLLAPFEPLPLYSVLKKKGYSHDVKQLESGDWEVLFTRGSGQNAEPKHDTPAPNRSSNGEGEPTSFIELDARGFEPPQPMVKILEALSNLPARTGIRAHTDRRPMHLYAHLEERGFVAESVEQTDGSFLTHIRPR